MDYVYIDESGSEGNDSRYIVFASIQTSDPRALEKVIKKIWRAKPQFHPRGELHAYDADDALRRRVLLALAKLDIGFRYHLVDKQKSRISGTNLYYRELSRFIKSHSGQCLFTIDKKDTDKKRTKVITKLHLERSFSNASFEESHNVRQLQAVDFVAWAIGRKYELEDTEFYDLLEYKESPLL
jgi:hypothetical protein